MPRAGPRKVQRHSLEFKLKAVKLSQLKGVDIDNASTKVELQRFVVSKIPAPVETAG